MVQSASATNTLEEEGPFGNRKKDEDDEDDDEEDGLDLDLIA